MSDKKEFDNTLDSCLSRLLKGASFEECLKDYPEQAEALRPLLETAVAAREAMIFEPRPTFKIETWRQVLITLAEMKQKNAEPGISWLDAFKARWATVGVSIALVILMAGGGLITASGDSLPGDFLYSFKLAAEQVILNFSFGDEAKAETYARLADRRVDEIVQMAGKADVANIEEATGRLDGYLVSITTLLSPPSDFSAANATGDETIPPWDLESDSRDGEMLLTGNDAASNFELLLQQYGLQQVTALEQALGTAPEASKAALEHALAVTLAGYRDILDVVE